MEDLISPQIKDSCKLALPNGLKELMSDITREVLRYQPRDLYQFISDYLAALLVTRDNLSIASYICGDVTNCGCEPELHSELKEIGLDEDDVKTVRDIVTKYFKKGKVDEGNLLMNLIKETNIGEDVLPYIQDAIRNAYIRHQAHNTTKYESSSDSDKDEIMCAAKHTLDLYRKSAPNEETYGIMTEKIQETYRSYGVTRNSALKSKHNQSADKAVTLIDPNLVAQTTTSYDIAIPMMMYTEEEASMASSVADPEIQMSSTMIQKRIVTMSSTSLGGSFMALPAAKPYSAHDIDILPDLYELPEKEHAHIDYTAADPHISLVTEDKNFYKRDKKISFNEAELRMRLQADDDSESKDSRNESVRADEPELFYGRDVMRVESDYDGDTEMECSDMNVGGSQGQLRNSS